VLTLLPGAVKSVVGTLIVEDNTYNDDDNLSSDYEYSSAELNTVSGISVTKAHIEAAIAKD